MLTKLPYEFGMWREAEAKSILNLVIAGHFKMAEHTFVRANERAISRRQIIHCAEQCIYYKWQEINGTHLFVGHLDAEATGGFSAAVRDGVIIVTVFRRRLTRWERKLVKGKRP